MKHTRYKGQPLVELHTPLTDHEQRIVDLVAGNVPVPSPPKPKYHGDECNCTFCCDIRAAMDRYLEARELFSQNGFI